MPAVSPTTAVTEIPGRFSPTYVVDKRLLGNTPTDQRGSTCLAFLPRCETVDATFDTPTTVVQELGTNFNVGEIDDLPSSKVSLSVYDVGPKAISLLTGKNAPSGQTTTYGYNDFNTGVVDLVRYFADPNGNVFASMYNGDLCIDEFGFNLKAQSNAMESYSLSGFNELKFRGLIVSKAYVATAADVTNGYLNPSLGNLPIPLPVPTGTQPPSYWIQRGSLNFLKIERYRASQGFVRIPEVTSTTPTVSGTCHFVPGPQHLTCPAGDIVAGDVFFFTYCVYTTSARTGGLYPPTGTTATPSATGGTLAAGTYGYVVSALDALGNETAPGAEFTAVTTGSTGSIALNWNAVAGAASYNVYGRTAGGELLIINRTTHSYTDTGAVTPAGAPPSLNTTGSPIWTIFQTTPDTSDPAAVPTRLTPFTISGNNIPRGQSLDVKMALKRERVEGIGDVDGMYGPSSAPEVSVSLEVKKTDFSLAAILETGSPAGTDTTGTVAGDFYDPNYMTRSQLTSPVALQATIYDPRNAGVVLKTYTLPTIVLKNDNDNATTKNAATVKYTGSDRTGNLTVAVVVP